MRFIVMVLLCVSPNVFADTLASLPVAPEAAPPEGDWLVHGLDAHAGVYRSDDSKELILSNGLIRRTFRIAPNAATVGLDNLMTGEAVLRGVKPEATIALDGEAFDVGGLTGQSNYAFLRNDWVDALEADLNAMHFAGFEVGEPQERFAWKRVRHHAPDVAWPPEGVHLRMDYVMPDPAAQPRDEAASALGRTLLFEERFDALDAGWRVHTSSAHPRSSFENEGKLGEIYTPANTAVFAERDWPEGAHLAEVTFDTGTDKSSSWGPGIALVWPDRTIKLNLRPAGDPTTFGVHDGLRENPEPGGQLRGDMSKPVTIRMRLEDGNVHCETDSVKGRWQTLQSVRIPSSWGPPDAVRIGKLDYNGGAEDHSSLGGLVRLHVLQFAAYSAKDPNAVATDGHEPAPHPLEGVTVSVHYELYDGAPIYSKWITVRNDTKRSVKIDSFTSEILAAVEFASTVDNRSRDFEHPNLHVETDYSFGGMSTRNTTQHSVHWVADPDYATQVNYQKTTPCLLEVRPKMGPAVTLPPGETFASFRAYVVIRDSYDRERNGLAQRRLYRLAAPWSTENPLMMHVRHADEESVKLGIDQCAEAGFEMIILTFGSGFNIESKSPRYQREMKELADYGRSKGIEIGGYSLLASRKISAEDDVVLPEGQRPTFGQSPCLQSEWGQRYFDQLYSFFEETGFMLLEHDGSYPGDPCLSTEHPGHDGWEDSQWKQWTLIRDFYQWCRGQGIFLNVPDYYYMVGSNKCGMGYRETNWSLPRAQQVIHTRQNIFDGTWHKSPSMGWMFVPLTQYHGGGAAATIEPLDEHLDHYERMLFSNLALGVQACYRGPRLFDTPRTQAMLTKWVGWYKQYRDILESDLIHGRRADARGIDWMLHVNPRLQHKGMLVAFNPLDEPVTGTLDVDLYYTGLTDIASLRTEGGDPVAVKLGRDYSAKIEVTMPALGFTWVVVE